MSNIFDMFDKIGAGRPSYTSEEIDAAMKKAKKTGRSFMEVLQETAAAGKSAKEASTTDKRPASTTTSTGSSGKPHSSSSAKSYADSFSKPHADSSAKPHANSSAKPHASGSMKDVEDLTHAMEQMSDQTKKNQKKADDMTDSMNQMLLDMNRKNQEAIQDMYASINEADSSASHPGPTSATSSDGLCTSTQQELAELNRRLEKDFGVKKEFQPAGVEAFDGVQEVISQHVFGQPNLLKKMIVAFKRPFILTEGENHAKNCFYIYGPKDSGKHYALTKLTEELAKRHILKDGTVYTMDLSRYTAAGKDNVFLQDLYVALQAPSNVILFENFEECHISYLTYISDLVIKGECYLQDRYMLQNGQLINAANAFTKETVSTFSAKGKYLAFLSTKNEENLANVFGAPFINALGDICIADKLNEESWRSIAKVQWTQLVEKAAKQLSFVLVADEEPLLDAAVAATGKNAGTQGLISFFDKLLKGLATVKLEGSYGKDTEVKIFMEDSSAEASGSADVVSSANAGSLDSVGSSASAGSSASSRTLYAQIGDEKIDLMNNLPQAYSGNISAVKAEMDNIVGLTEVKKYILSLEEYYNTQKRRTEAGLKASDVSKHMIFTGNPGTGKTTIARIISRYLKAIGVLTGGQLVEVSRADLVGRYVGHTAPLVNQVIKSALGGVLFIDEAYSLYRGKDDNFGLEAIDTLVKGIEDNRDNLIVILAGYSNEMEEFLESNSGLKSRFPNIIDFPDYTGEELLAITKITVKSKGYILDEAAEKPLLDYYNKIQATCPDTAGNGRLVRNKVEEAILNQSRRLVAEPDADLSLLKVEDWDTGTGPLSQFTSI